MRTLKHLLEKPNLVWVGIGVLFALVFWFKMQHLPMDGEQEKKTYEILQTFAEGGFPPKIYLIKTLPDWGHIGYYALMGFFTKSVHSDLSKVKAFHLFFVLACLFIFVRLGYFFIYRNRLNPMWISVALLVFAANPYLWKSAFQVHFLGMFLFCILLSLYCYEKELIGWSSIFLTLAVFIDWQALLLAVAFLISYFFEDKGKLLKPAKWGNLLLPFLGSALLLGSWHGLVPQGEARDWWQTYLSASSVFHLDRFFYALILLVFYSLFFTWVWGLKARSGALTFAAVGTALCIPFYFFFPIQFELWNEAKYGLQVPLGYVDQLAYIVAGPYKSWLLFIPWLVGLFLFFQLFLMDIFDQSKRLRYFIILYFFTSPFVLGFGDESFLIVLPFILLLTLSETLVGEHGKLN